MYGENMDKYWELKIYFSNGTIVYARGKNQKGVEYLFVSLYQRVVNALGDKWHYDYNLKQSIRIPQEFPPRSGKNWKYSMKGPVPQMPRDSKIEAFTFYPITKEVFELNAN